jgi:hypothetical protein
MFAQQDVEIGLTGSIDGTRRAAVEHSRLLAGPSRTRIVKMLSSNSRLLPLIAVAVVSFFVSGCGSFSARNLPDFDDMFGVKAGVRDEEQHRQSYQKSRDPEDLRWLLANRISSGMSVSEVGRIIGQEGRRLYDDTWIKKGGGYYQSGDEAWKWEQDRNGQSLILVFREGRLVNFDPGDYAEKLDPFEF